MCVYIIIKFSGAIDTFEYLTRVNDRKQQWRKTILTNKYCQNTLIYILRLKVPRPWRRVLDTKLCDKVCQWLAIGRWFSLGTQVSSTNKTDHHDIIEILLKVALNTINQTKPSKFQPYFHTFWIREKYSRKSLLLSEVVMTV